MILERHVPIDIPPLAELAPHNDTKIIEEYFITMGFATLLKRMYEGDKPQGVSVKKQTKGKAAKADSAEDASKNIQKSLF